MKKLALLSLLGALTCGPASATIMQVTVSGTITSGNWQRDFWHSTSLVGQKFIAVVLYDSDGGLDAGTPGVNRRIGGEWLGFPYQPSPILNAFMLVKGMDIDFHGEDFIGEARSSAVNQAAYFESGTNNGVDSGLILNFSGAVPFDLDESYAATGVGSGFWGYESVFEDVGGRGALTFSSIEVSAYVPGSLPTSVPEPQAWSMMIAGFALTGSLLRSRRRRQPARF